MKKIFLLSIMLAPAVTAMDEIIPGDKTVLEAARDNDRARQALDLVMVYMMGQQEDVVLCRFDEKEALTSELTAIADIIDSPDAAPRATMLECIGKQIDSEKATALIRICAYKGYTKTIAFLAKIKLIDPIRALQSLLFCCFMYPEPGLYKAVEALLDAGADPNQPGYMVSLVSAAINARKPSVAHLLLDRGADPDPKYADRMDRPYFMALQRKNNELAERIGAAILARKDSREDECDPIANDNNKASAQPESAVQDDTNNSNI